MNPMMSHYITTFCYVLHMSEAKIVVSMATFLFIEIVFSKKDVKLKRYSPGRYIHDYKHTSCLLNFPEITFCVTFRVDMVPWCWNSTYDLDTYRNVEACNLNSEKERGQSKATLRVQNGSLFKE